MSRQSYKLRISAECVLCGKVISKEVSNEDIAKSLLEIFKDEMYALHIVDANGNIIVWGLVCKDCVEKLKR